MPPIDLAKEDSKGRQDPVDAPNSLALEQPVGADDVADLQSLPAGIPSNPVEFLALYEQLQLQLEALDGAPKSPSVVAVDDDGATTVAALDDADTTTVSITPEPVDDLSSLTDEDRNIVLAQRAVQSLVSKQGENDLTEQEALETAAALDDATMLLAGLEQAQQDRLESEAAAEVKRLEHEHQAAEAAKSQAVRRRELLHEWELLTEECDEHEVQHAALEANIVDVLRQRQNKEPIQQTSMAEALQQFNLAMNMLKDLEVTEQQFDVDTKALVSLSN
jgi:hypothetical protein